VIAHKKAGRIGAAVAFTALVALPAAGFGAAAAQVDQRLYVALGDSYTAGPVIPVQQTDPAGCLRSDHNYPHLVAAGLGVHLRDASCSGATTADMTSPQGVTPGPNPPQFDRLTTDTGLVTLGISGNDIGFTEIIEHCSSPSPLGTPCQDHYVVNGDDQISDRINAVAPKVAAVLQGIRQRSPKARVFVVDYLDILPVSGTGCWPQMPVTPGDVPYLRAKEVQLNAMLAAEAASNHAGFVDAYAASIGRDACKLPTIRWVEPVVPVSPAFPVHPNAAGMAGAAAVVLAQVSRAHG
jgi:hypothetical protein